MPKSNDLTANDRKLLALLVGFEGVIESRPSGLGQLLYPLPKKLRGYDNRSAQGLALAGGKAAYRLRKIGLITTFSDSMGGTIYRLTDKGRELTKQFRIEPGYSQLTNL